MLQLLPSTSRPRIQHLAHRPSTRAFHATPAHNANYFKISLYRWRLAKDRSGRWLKRAVGRDPGTIQPLASAISTRMSDIMESQYFKDDFGLLPGTLITKTPFLISVRGQPGIFTAPIALLRAQGRLLWRRFQDLFSLIFVWRMNGKPRVPIWAWRDPNATGLRSKTKELYTAQYRDYAQGNLEALEVSCCDGLVDKYRAAVRRRPLGKEQLDWEMVKWRGMTVIAHRATPVPEAPTVKGRKTVLRQAVVRVRSVQKLRGKQMEVDEWVVMQCKVFKGEPEGWKIQGFVEPNLWKELDDVFTPPQQEQAMNSI